MSRRWPIFIGAILVAMFIAAGLVAVLKIDVTPKDETGAAVVRNRNFAEGVQIAQHGLYGVNLVSIGKVHMRKFRKGPFTIGAINELVLEDVSLVLPEELWAKGGRESADSKHADADEDSQSGPKAMLGRLGINPKQISMSGKIPRFSALTMRDLRIARLVGTNAVPWFAARRGEARRHGLKLEGGWSVERGLTNVWKEAMLIVEPELKLITS